MTLRAVVASSLLDQQSMAPGFTSRSLRRIGSMGLDPFMSLDEFVMSEPTFPPHPHAGFSAVTVMFPDSQGGFLNRDSLGDRSTIEPGALHWTQAAHGMMHEEIPERAGVPCHGMQIFVNLAARHKHAPPRAFHLAAAAVPTWSSGDGVRVRVLAGAVDDVASPLSDLLTPVTMLDVYVSPGGQTQLPFAAPTAFALVIDGGGFVGPTAVAAHEALAFGPGATLPLRAGASGLHVLVCGGTPIEEPLVFGGPFAMSSKDDLADAFARFQRGEMGALRPTTRHG